MSESLQLSDLVERLNTLVRAYRALSWLSECVSEVPADRVGHVMMPLDRAMEALLADFWVLVGQAPMQQPRAPK